jgi:hypothetical protein
MRSLTRFSGWLYAQGLNLYPSDFRKEFGDEMETVFSTEAMLAEQNGIQNFTRYLWLELKGWLTSVLREHLQTRRNTMTEHDQFAPLKSSELLAALTIFLIPALGTLLIEILGAVNIDKTTAWLGPMMVVLFLGSLIIPLILAVVRGFPRWSPPYLGVLLVGFTFFVPFWRVWGWIYPSLTRWLGGMSTWSLPVLIFVQGMQAAIIWFLVLLSTLILVSILRLIPHTRALWARIRRDWTQLSFFLYGGLVFHIILIFDEYQQDEPWLIAAWLVLAAGCWLYLHTRGQTQRILILLCGATLAMWIVAAGKFYLVPFQKWGPWFERFPPDTERWFESLRTLADWFCLVVALLLPSLLKLLPQNLEKTPREDPILA